ncbi:MAG: L-rhamnose/proton symporter RhaT [Bryobacteraceae bacterium]
MNSAATGWLMVMAAAVMQGSWALPQKFVRGWAWEKMWLLFCMVALAILPWLLVALAIPQPGQVYANAGSGVLLETALFGAGWGVGNVLFGLGVASVGMALAFAIIISLTAALGSLVPLAIQNPDQLTSLKGLLLMGGLLLVIAGVTFCSKAGALKDPGGSAVKGNFTKGLLICIGSGIASPMMNFAFTFGKPIQAEAARLGVQPGAASITVLAVAVGAGFVVNAAYTAYLLKKNKSWSRGAAADRGRNLACVAAMGSMWLFGFFLYGIGTTSLGKLGTAVGWPVLMTTMVLVANVWGLVTGEWKNADRRAFRYLGAGLALMVTALVLMGWPVG